MEQFSVIILISAAVTAAASWLFGIVEFIGIWRFWPWVYRLGVKVIDQPHPELDECTSARLIGDSDSVRASIGSGGEVLFRAPMNLFSFRIQTLLPVKGTIETRDGGAQVVGRLPLSMLAFISSWLMVVVVGGGLADLMYGRIEGILIRASVLGFVIVLVGFSIVLERRWFRGAIVSLAGDHPTGGHKNFSNTGEIELDEFPVVPKQPSVVANRMRRIIFPLWVVCCVLGLAWYFVFGGKGNS